MKEEKINYVAELAKFINENTHSAVNEIIIVHALQNLLFYATQGKTEFEQKVKYENFIPKTKAKVPNFVIEHVYGRKKAAVMALKLAKVSPFTKETLYQFLQKYCFYIKVPREKGINGKTINQFLKKIQNKEFLITFEEYENALEHQCGWLLTAYSKEQLKNRMK